MAFLWNSTNVTYLAFTNSADMVYTTILFSSSVPASVKRFVSFKMYWPDTTASHKIVFLDVSFFNTHFRACQRLKHCSSFSCSLSIPLLFPSFPLNSCKLQNILQHLSFMICSSFLPTQATHQSQKTISLNKELLYHNLTLIEITFKTQTRFVVNCLAKVYFYCEIPNILTVFISTSYKPRLLTNVNNEKSLQFWRLFYKWFLKFYLLTSLILAFLPVRPLK